MSDHRLPKKLLYGELQHGKRSRGGQKKRLKDTLKASLKAFNISPASWERTACDRSLWRLASRTAATEDRRQLRKSANRSPSAANIPYHHCQRTFKACLTSHLHTHRKRLSTVLVVATEEYTHNDTGTDAIVHG